MKRATFIGIFIVLIIQIAYSQKNAKPIISSHNFNNKSELWESIGKGIFNYQADVMYIYGKLYVTSLMPDSAGHKLPTLTELISTLFIISLKRTIARSFPAITETFF